VCVQVWGRGALGSLCSAECVCEGCELLWPEKKLCGFLSLSLSLRHTLSYLSLSLIHSRTHRAGRRGSFGDACSVGTGCSGGTDRAGDSGEEEELQVADTPRMIDSPQPLMVIGLSRRTNRLYANGVLLAPSCGSFILHPGHGYLLFTALGAQPYVGGPTAWDVATLV
jgi:hypothetical protein